MTPGALHRAFAFLAAIRLRSIGVDRPSCACMRINARLVSMTLLNHNAISSKEPELTAPLNLIVTLQPLPGHLPDVVSTLTTLARASRQEAGCLRYDLAVGQELVYLFEAWTDRQALAAHEKEPHFVQGVAALNRLCASQRMEFVEWQAQG